MIYKRLTHITMTDDCIDDIKTDGVVKAYRATIYNREGGQFKIELDGKIIEQSSTMESIIEKVIDLAIPNDLIVDGTGLYAEKRVRSLKRAVLIALAKKTRGGRMSTRLMIEVRDIDWRYCLQPPDSQYLIGKSMLGNFRIDTLSRETNSLQSYKVTFCPETAPVPLNERTHKTLEDAQRACQQTYRTTILSTIFLKREDPETVE